ncbi:MAG: heavy-metal-associated domain-containing protein [Bacteroidales bacterium]|jgi:copper chaperone CopZ|nr:heavy-metal-associated domain-containing protein [Bacteroidales bacterium]
MNKLKVICITIVMCTAMSVNAQQKEQEKWSEVIIQTNGTCQACKNKIEGGIAYEKGVKTVDYDLATSKVKIVYNPQKTSVDNLCKAINKLGYTANSSPATREKPCDMKEENKSSSGNHDHKHNHGQH